MRYLEMVICWVINKEVKQDKVGNWYVRSLFKKV